MKTTTQEQASSLSEYDFRVLVDTSGSMATADTPNGMTRLKYAAETAKMISSAVAVFDSDGIDIIFFGAKVDVLKGVGPESIDKAFSRMPSGSTPTARALSEAFKLGKASGKKSFNVVFTDGEPDNKAEVKAVIEAQSNSQNTDEECTILFLQVGKDAGATAFLTQLDDDLAGKFDIVDSMHIDDVGDYVCIEDLIMKAIND